MKELQQTELGKKSHYKTQYDADLLFPIPRYRKRQEIEIVGNAPFHGCDLWTAYEISWLNSKGKPQIAIGFFTIDSDSECMIESKSFKLYLNSFNQTQFDQWDSVKNILERDISLAVGMDIHVELFSPQQFLQCELTQFSGICLDELDIEIDTYQPQPQYLQVRQNNVTETLYSDLLKSNCLVTNQPDWGSVWIHYQGQQIDHAGLLKYIISLREHNEFHEQCVERIFMDISRQCQPEKLTVFARYTRRGGLDINPFRSNFENCNWQWQRLGRQ
ncbi:MAG: NADPH-dependent 7-cyano-7-deazaguanine reductase QueF [Legionellales bacterium]|nr:NADPH-dependent 7-cyano-7-deazaguanine reductase QueF [Legionellales bacterium]